MVHIRHFPEYIHGNRCVDWKVALVQNAAQIGGDIDEKRLKFIDTVAQKNLQVKLFMQ